MAKSRRATEWDAVRSGPRYCAPACGMGCTWKAHQLAVAESKKLAASIGEGWTTRVWENLGWHYEAISPCRQIRVIHHRRTESFGAYFNQWYCSAPTARQAARGVVASASEHAAEVLRTVSRAVSRSPILRRDGRP